MALFMVLSWNYPRGIGNTIENLRFVSFQADI
jgi:hypothetical protein